jgi:hypothetical protein
MYQYFDQFTKDWRPENLIEVLARLPEYGKVGETWKNLIAAVGVEGFVHLAINFPNQEVKIPSIYEILIMFAAQEIVVEMKSKSREEAFNAVLGELKIKEVEEIVDRLQATSESNSDE